MQTFENIAGHISSNILMGKEMNLVIFDTLCTRLGDIMQQGAPACGQARRGTLNDAQYMGVNIFRSWHPRSWLLAHPTQFQHFWNNKRYQTQFHEQVKALGRMWRKQQFIHFITDTFETNFL